MGEAWAEACLEAWAAWVVLEEAWAEACLEAWAAWAVLGVWANRAWVVQEVWVRKACDNLQIRQCQQEHKFLQQVGTISNGCKSWLLISGKLKYIFFIILIGYYASRLNPIAHRPNHMLYFRMKWCVNEYTLIYILKKSFILKGNFLMDTYTLTILGIRTIQCMKMNI